LATLTVRGLAAELGVAPMTLYTYVPGREELADLVVDAAYAAMHRADTTGRPWRERLTAVAEENRVLHRRHPWTTRIDPSRPVLGPGETAKYEHELAAFDELADLATLDDVDRDAALTFLLDVVRAAALVEQGAATDDAAAWWAARAPVLATVLDPARYPRAVRVGAAAGAAAGSARDPDRAWRFGLERTLDGLAALIS
jgi:AcrR family transcriptional regulator